MKKFILIIIMVLVSCSQGISVDNGDWSGTINANSEESKIVEKLAAAYVNGNFEIANEYLACLLYTSPSPRDKRQSRMPSSA